MRRANFFGCLAAGGALVFSATEARAQEPFAPAAGLTFPDLIQAVQRRSAALQVERLNAELAAADAQQAAMPYNPVADASWGTIPIGPTNPSNLSSPLRNVPSYGVGLSYTFLVGKRPARQRRAAALEEGARAGYEAAAREQALGLARSLGRLAVARLRLDGLKGLVEQGKGMVVLAKSRLDAGQGTPLEVDRLEIELGRTEQQVLAAEAEDRGARASCAPFVGVPCSSFADGAEARQFLQSWVERAEGLTGAVEQRAELRALDAQRRAALAEGELARAAALPDPTVRFGYLYDSFVISGNQRNSVNLSLSLPLPFFDRGQALQSAAAARQQRASAAWQRALAADRARLTPLREALVAQRQRQQSVVSRLLPRARAALVDLEKATSNRLLPLTEVIQIRRTVNELLIEEADSFSDAYETSLELISLLTPTGNFAPRPGTP